MENRQSYLLNVKKDIIGLNLYDTTVLSDVSFLTQLSSLTTLDLSSNSISNFSALAELTNVTLLELADNSISISSEDLKQIGSVLNTTIY